MKKLLVVMLIAALIIPVIAGDIEENFMKVDPPREDTFLVSLFDKQINIDEKDGVKSNSISDCLTFTSDKTLAVFHTWATNLGSAKVGVKTYIKNTETEDIVLLKEHARFPAISPDGKYIVYEWVEDYENDLPAIYVYNVKTQKETFIGYTSGGNNAGWKSQVFEWENSDTVRYQTSYGGGGWKNMTYIVGAKI